ncbi:MAG: 30S ribosomal protein S3 [Candidatus Aenigmarchaeota archaeon]|nr:30S ribosomal protein S3 [Candidatus Aenigmarchaeota archaeon]
MKERIFITRSKEEVNLEEFVRSYFKAAKCGDIEIQKTPIMTRIVLHTTTPGLIIGMGGERIKNATELLRSKFKIENPQIDVQKIEDQYLDAKVMAKSLASQVEGGMNYKRLANLTMEKIMRSGAIGCELILSGKLSGERSRRERFTQGYLKKCGEPSLTMVRRGFAVANPKLGNIGVLVKIMVERPVPMHTKLNASMKAAHEQAEKAQEKAAEIQKEAVEIKETAQEAGE